MVTWFYEVLLPMVLLCKVLFYSFQRVLTSFQGRTQGLSRGQGQHQNQNQNVGEDPFTGLPSWEHLIPSSVPFLWKVYLNICSSCGPSDTTYALNFIPITGTTSQCALLALSTPSSLSITGLPQYPFWALSFVYHELDVLIQCWLFPIHMLMTPKSYL